MNGESIKIMKIDSSIYSKIKRNQIISKTYLIDGKVVYGLSFKLGAKKLVLAKARRGFIMCGYLNMKTADKFNDAAAIVKGVANFEQLLKAKVVVVSKAAKKCGISEGMLAKEAIVKLS